MRNIWSELRAAHRDCNVLEHPFYRRWSKGALSREELCTYVGQYSHLVHAIPRALRLAGPDAPDDYYDPIGRHAREELRHVELWCEFAASVGARKEVVATQETEAMVCSVVHSGSWQDALLGVCAIESTQGPIAATKLAGLRAYGVTKRRATAYLRVHAHRDDERAAELRALLAPHLSTETTAHVDRARGVWEGNWRLLDAVRRLARARTGEGSALPANTAP